MKKTGTVQEAGTGISKEELYNSTPVPEKIRTGWVPTAVIYSGNMASISCCMGGGGLIAGLAFGPAVGAMLIGLAILVFVVFIPLGKIGAEQGLSSYYIGESAFGTVGSNFVSVLIATAIPCIGWYGVNVAVASDAVASVFKLGPTAATITMIVMGLIFALPSMFGTNSMAWLNYLCIPVMFFIIIFGVIRSLSVLGGIAPALAAVPTEPKSFLWGVNLMVGLIIVGCSFVADYTRWQKNSLGGVAASGVVGLFPFVIILAIPGMIMSISAGTLGVTDTWNLVSVMSAIGMPSFALLLIILLQWTTCIASTYSTGIALSKLFKGNRRFWTMLSALLGIILSVTGIINYFLDMLGILASWVSPVVGILITEYFIISKRKLVVKKGVYLPGVIAWFIAGFVAWLVPFFIPAINAMIVGGLLYFILDRFMRPKVVETSDVTPAAQSPQS
ncbi:hypothetical protein LJC34_04535 [Oscillospiraceae bacterium OttesenSCG-928-G22]|nr:hypothetical protein [Oscillospiraceae bacterium OttesenSCG-928-G22]